MHQEIDIQFEYESYLLSYKTNLVNTTPTKQAEMSDSLTLRPYQDTILNLLNSKSTGLDGIENPAGSGKTILQIKSAERYVKTGKVIYVGISSLAMNETIIPKFKASLPNYKIGDLNSVDQSNDIFFFTPVTFLNRYLDGTKILKSILASASCILLDEVHHMPEYETTPDLKVINRLELICRSYKDTKRILTFTATHYRLDKKVPFGIKRNELASILYTQELVDQGYCPEIYFLPVVIKATDFKYKWTHSDCMLKFNPVENDKYFTGLADTINKVHELNNSPFSCFLNRVSDCEKLKSYLAKVGLRVGVLISSSTKQERLQVVKDIKDGKLHGYVTCDVGAESLDIPPMGVIHLISKTRSLGRLGQRIGRGFRLFPGKNHILVVDYIYAKKSIVDNVCGLTQILEITGSQLPKAKIRAGGVIVAQTGNRTTDDKYVGILIDEIDQAIIKGKDDIKQRLYELAASGITWNELLEKNSYLYRLCRDFMNPNKINYDVDFTQVISLLNPQWVVKKDINDEEFVSNYICKNHPEVVSDSELSTVDPKTALDTYIRVHGHLPPSQSPLGRRLNYLRHGIREKYPNIKTFKKAQIDKRIDDVCTDIVNKGDYPPKNKDLYKHYQLYKHYPKIREVCKMVDAKNLEIEKEKEKSFKIRKGI